MTTARKGKTLAALEREIIDVIRFVGVKSGVPPPVYGAMCHEVRIILNSSAHAASKKRKGTK